MTNALAFRAAERAETVRVKHRWASADERLREEETP